MVANTTRRLDPALLEAAQTLGASRRAAALQVVVPGVIDRSLHRHARAAGLGLDLPDRRRADRHQLRHHLLHQPAGQVPRLPQRVRRRSSSSASSAWARTCCWPRLGAPAVPLAAPAAGRRRLVSTRDAAAACRRRRRRSRRRDRRRRRHEQPGAADPRADRAASARGRGPLRAHLRSGRWSWSVQGLSQDVSGRGRPGHRRSTALLRGAPARAAVRDRPLGLRQDHDRPHHRRPGRAQRRAGAARRQAHPGPARPGHGVPGLHAVSLAHGAART